MMCCLKMNELGRKRQEPSSRSKISLCCQFCKNSCKAVKNFLWHRRDESADIEVIGRSRWLYCRYLGRHNLSLGFEPLAHHPHGHSLVGDWSGEKAAQPTSSHLTAPYTHDEVAEWKSKCFHCQKVSSKDIISLNMSFPSICPVAIKGGCVYDGKGDVIVTMQAWEQKASLTFLLSAWRELRGQSQNTSNRQAEWEKEKGNKNA